MLSRRWNIEYLIRECHCAPKLFPALPFGLGSGPVQYPTRNTSSVPGTGLILLLPNMFLVPGAGGRLLSSNKSILVQCTVPGTTTTKRGLIALQILSPIQLVRISQIYSFLLM